MINTLANKNHVRYLWSGTALRNEGNNRCICSERSGLVSGRCQKEQLIAAAAERRGRGVWAQNTRRNEITGQWVTISLSDGVRLSE